MDEELLTSSAPHRPTRAFDQLLITNYQSPADIGTAHHAFLQFVSLDHIGSAAELKAEAERLVGQQSLTAEEMALLDFKGLAEFWRSESGENIRAQKFATRRELRFTARLPRNRDCPPCRETNVVRSLPTNL